MELSGRGVGEGQSNLDSIEGIVRKTIGDLKGTVETYEVQRVTGGGHEWSTNGGGGHRVAVSFVVPGPATPPVRIKQEVVEEEPESGHDLGAVAVPVSRSSLSLEDFPWIKDLKVTSGEGQSLEVDWGNSEDPETLDMTDILTEEELNQILENFMESAEELQDYNTRHTDGSITVKNEELLHAAIDKHLSQSKSQKSKEEGEWNSPLFNNLGDDDEANFRQVKIKEEIDSDSESVEAVDPSEDDTMDISPSEEETPARVELPQQVVEVVPAPPAGPFTFARIMKVSEPAAPNPQPIQQQAIPQMVLPASMYTMNQVAYVNVMSSASQNQILRPANLPAVSALFNGARSQSLNWAIARYTAGASVGTMMNVDPSPARAPIIAARPSVLVSRSSASQSTPQTSSQISTVGTRVRCRKTSPLLRNDMTNSSSPVASSQKPEVISQFAKLQSCEDVGVPEGHSYQSWILEQGLHNVRKQGLHRNQGSNDYPFKCPLCDKKYRNPNGIKYHAKYGHGPKCVFTCSICQRDYATRHGLSAHKRSHQVVEESGTGETSSQSRSMKNISTIIIHTQAPSRPA